MKPPIIGAHRNIVFGAGGVDDAWGLYRLAMHSYDGKTRREKKELLFELARFAYGIEADFTVLRVMRPWSAEEYVLSAQETLDGRYGHPELWRAYLERDREMLAGRRIARPEVYLSIRLPAGARSPAEALAHALRGEREGLGDELRRMFGVRNAAGLSERRLRALQADEHKLYGRVLDYLDAERAATHELQWLIRRAFCRGLGEPLMEERWRPQALWLADDDGQDRYQPLEASVLRLCDSPITIDTRRLQVESELGDSYQAFLVLGSVPEVVTFPGRQAELMFAPLEGLEFPVDAAFASRWMPNAAALSLVKKRVIDADHILKEEAHGDHGPSRAAYERPREARDLEDYLSASDRPPLLMGQLTLAVGAPSGEELEERIERLRRAYQPIELYRPAGEQLKLFCSHLPAQARAIEDYTDPFTIEAFGAMVPTATHAVGSDVGPYIGHTLSGSQQPVLFDLTEASRTSRPPSIVLAAPPGRGKTMTAQTLATQAVLQGSLVVDMDPKGDHRLHELPALAEHCQVIELDGTEAQRGVLDPFRIAAPGTAEDLAANFLVDVLPEPMPAGWKTAVRQHVREVLEREGPAATCSLVIDALGRGDTDAKEAARALAVYADTGLAKLAFARGQTGLLEQAERQVTVIRIRNLPRPIPGTPKSELAEEERIGQAIMRLLVAKAMHILGSNRDRHKVLLFDEAWFLLQDARGRRLIEHLNRWGRSEFATPILITHLVDEAEEIDNLIGARFVFGAESEREAARSLELLRLDPEDKRLIGQLLDFRKGRCFLRDYEGRVSAIQIDPGHELVRALDTTPNAHDLRELATAKVAAEDGGGADAGP